MKGTTMTRYARYLFAILLIITSFSTAGAVAQAAEPDPASSTFVTQLEGLTIDLGNSGEARFDPIEYYPPERYRGPAGTYTQEHIMFRVGNSDVFVTVMLGDTTPESWNQESVNGLSSGGNSHQILGRYADEEFGWLFTLDQNRMDILTASY